jgi:nucleoside-diphosphate-sugar epimerase
MPGGKRALDPLVMLDAAPAGLTFTPCVADMLLNRDGPVIVTGATGWVGQAILEMFDTLSGERAPARLQAFASTDRTMTLRSGRRVQAQAYTRLAECTVRTAIIFHCAFLTREHAGRLGVDDYVSRNRAISEAMAAFIERNGARSLFIPSSGAVYGPDRRLHDDLSRFPYAVLKLADEGNFSALGQRLGFNVAVIRIFNLAGPFVNKWESYALASIISDVLGGGPVVLRADRPVYRSYAFVRDVVDLAVCVMLAGEDVPAFDTAGEVTLELQELAERVVNVLNAPGCAIARPPVQAGAADRYTGDPVAFLALARKFGLRLTPLDRQIVATARYQAMCAG